MAASIVKAVKPKASPLAMLKVSGMAIIVRNAGMAMTASSQSISFIGDIMRLPTTINAGAVAAAGTAPINGAMNNMAANNKPVTIAVTPVRPPVATPAALSM